MALPIFSKLGILAGNYAINEGLPWAEDFMDKKAIPYLRKYIRKKMIPSAKRYISSSSLFKAPSKKQTPFLTKKIYKN